MSHIPASAMPHAIERDTASEAPAAEGIVSRIPARLRSTPALIAGGVALIGGLAVAALPLLRKAAQPAPAPRKRRAA